MSNTTAGTGFDPTLTADNSFYFANLLRWTSFLSLLGSTSVILAYTLYVRKSERYNNLTARLVFHTSFYDHILSWGLFFVVFLTGAGPTCNFLMFLQTWGTVGGIFVPCCLAYCVQEAVTKNSVPSHLEKYFHAGSFSLSLLISLLPLAGGYGWDESLGYCWFLDSEHKGLGWALGAYYIWVILGLIYNTIIWTWAAVTTYNLYRKTKSLQGAQVKTYRAHYGLIVRFMMYPIIIIIVQFPSVASQVQAWATGDFHLILTVMNQATAGLQGFLYALVWFGFDSAFKDFRAKYLRCIPELYEEESNTPSSREHADHSSKTKEVEVEATV